MTQELILDAVFNTAGLMMAKDVGILINGVCIKADRPVSRWDRVDTGSCVNSPLERREGKKASLVPVHRYRHKGQTASTIYKQHVVKYSIFKTLKCLLRPFKATS